MQIICSMVQMYPLAEREYQKDGQPAKFRSVELLLRQGSDYFLVEAIQETADRLAATPPPANTLLVATIQSRFRAYNDSQGRERRQAELRLIDIVNL